MIPISDDNPTLRTPIVTYLLLGAIGATWVFVQGAGLNVLALVSSICHYGLVPGELTGQAPVGLEVPLSDDLSCVVDRNPINLFTPLTSMFLHGSWSHILGNCLFFWVFGNNVEDSMGRLRFIVFYIVCGLAAAAAQVLVDPASPVPMVGASGAISGIMGAYLLLYPRVRVNMLFIFIIIIRIIPLPAWLVLLYWFGLQVVAGLPQLDPLNAKVSSGVAVWAHVGGFVAGLVLVKLFENPNLTSRRTTYRHRYHPDHP
ncbi:rhomboid family intramembrane serine protease [Vitiosangium sp. GDMCC 1.1324]|uniref:rhomboid family intramembrane serine protease n=1 Tax=Vitiosangium sp. (strain GDMCC 1.1324) TaxID=2138576 RepID=UPI000D376885|nr:rhomboid family intramembrane serine protease [Vitiosangium sp. GDMCC 1.1324]PTL80002.1 rhomboid family intramembrane serine protease [Vitiosangium sp. GDMCC 1.1324]